MRRRGRWRNALDFASDLTSKALSGERETMLGTLQILFIRANLVLQAIPGELATPSVVQLRNEISAALTGGMMAGTEWDAATAADVGGAGAVPGDGLRPHADSAEWGAYRAWSAWNATWGVYIRARSAECQACHEIPGAEAHTTGMAALREYPENLNLSNLYPDHFSGECQECHGLENWEPIAFNHLEVVECASCHLEDVPVSESDPEQIAHYPGDCLLCHTDTEDWTVASYNHMRSADCAGCHDWEKPAEHYVEYDFECQACHGHTDAWEHTSHHEGYTDCAGVPRGGDAGGAL